MEIIATNKKKRAALEDVSNECNAQKEVGGKKKCSNVQLKNPVVKLQKISKQTTTVTTTAAGIKKHEALGGKKSADRQKKSTKRRKSCNVDNLLNPIERLTVNLRSQSTKEEEVKPTTMTTNIQPSTLTKIQESSDNIISITIQQQMPPPLLMQQPLLTQLQPPQLQEQRLPLQPLQLQELQQAWIDVDADNGLYYLSEFVNDIFDYYKSRESKFRVPDYMQEQSDITTNMRSILVDWLVEVQQSFELNHETLYMAVKLIDIFSSRVPVKRNKLQLVGAVSLNLACKFERLGSSHVEARPDSLQYLQYRERCPPMLDDFVYVCDDAYPRNEFLKMEVLVFKTVGFDVGLPLSYTFLRRYAMCGRVNIQTLTLSRFILETSLMDYKFITYLESIMASACLFIAMAMNEDGSWDETMQHYTEYLPHHFEDVTYKLNDMICNPPEPSLTTIISKYSHPIFHEVAKIPRLTNEQLKLLIHS